MTSATDTPVYWDADTKTYRVTGFDEVTGVLRGSGWSSDPRNSEWANEALRELPKGSLLLMDPPEHTRLRRLLAPAFTPRAIEALRPRVAAVVDAVLDGLFDDGPEVDVLTEVAAPVPLAVICELFDVGTEGAELFAAETSNLVRLLEFNPTRDDLMRSATASTEVMLFLTPLLVERSNRPGDDLISQLLALDGLTLDEVLTTCILLLAAGHETTTNLITTGTRELLGHPEALPHLLADPARAVEELIRFTGPVKALVRTAVAEQRVGGARIGAGQTVVLDLHAANRDPRRFDHPDRLDLTREPTGHLGFGGGIHFCLGAALARLEATEMLPALFNRYPGLRPVDAPPRWRPSTVFHALEELPVSG